MSEMILQRLKQTALLVTLAMVLLTACSRATEPPPAATQTPLPPPLDVTFCDIASADICLEGFGQDADEKLLVLFKVNDPPYADIYMLADGPDGEIFFECQPSKDFPENVYCLGEPFPEGDPIKLNIYAASTNRLIAIGVFNVEYSNLPAPDVVFGAKATPTPSTSYPNPSYPNPSYPNPASP